LGDTRTTTPPPKPQPKKEKKEKKKKRLLKQAENFKRQCGECLGILICECCSHKLEALGTTTFSFEIFGLHFWRFFVFIFSHQPRGLSA